MSSIADSWLRKTAWATTFAILLEAMLAASCLGPVDERNTSADTRLFLWGWERPEDFTFLRNRPEVGVAFLAATLLVGGDRVQVRPRLQPLTVPDGAVLVAVARLETDPADRPGLDPELVRQAVEAVLAETDRDGVSTIQIDFDATVSERPFYSELLAGLRRGMTSGKRLSITALASWCFGDPWIGNLPIDEAVPMLFQMGPDSEAIERRLATGRDFALPVCGSSVGLSLDETRLWPFIGNRRAYLFNPSPWTEQSALAAIKRWEGFSQ